MGDGIYDGAVEDEYQALYVVGGSSGYTDVTIPFSAFVDDNTVFPGADDGFDYARLLEIVVAIGGLTAEKGMVTSVYPEEPPTT